MPDVNLGTVYTQIDLDTNLLNQRVADVVEIWRNMQSSTQKVTTDLSRSMVDGVTKYQRQLDIVADKLERQRSLITQLQETADKPVVGKNSAAEVARATEQLEREKIKLKELEAQFDDTYDAMRDFISKQDQLAAKAQETSRKMEMKEAGEDAKEGTDLLISGLRAVNEIAPDLGGNLDTIITQINAIRQAMTEGTPTMASWATAIVAGVGIAITVIMALVNWYQEMREEQRRAFEEGTERVREYAQSIAELETNLRVLSSAESSTDDLRAARDQLASSFPELVVGYDNEGKAILANNDAIRDQIELYRQKQAAARQDVIDNGAMYAREAEYLRKEIARLKEEIARDQELAQKSAAELYAENPYESEINVQERLESTQQKLEDLDREYVNVAQNSKQYYEAVIEDSVRLTKANGDVIIGLHNMDQEHQIAARQMMQTFKDFEGFLTEEQLQGIADQISQMFDNPEQVAQYTAQWREANAEIQKQADLAYILTAQYGQQEATVGDLSDAYQKLTSGAALSRDELQKLAQTFPTIYEYLDQTHDRTLKNGKILTDVMGQIDYGNQIDSLNDIATAYGKLSDGQQLSVEQLYALAAAYPEVAAYLQETGDYTLKNGEILKELFEVRKQVHLQQLEAARDEMEAAKKETLAVIDGIQQQITAYGELARVRGGSLKAASGNGLDEGRNEQRYSKAIADQQAATKELEEQLAKAEQLQKDIDAANARIETIRSQAAGIDTFTGSSGKGKASTKTARNEALAEELKQLDHLSKTERINDDQKLARLEVLQATYRKNADERMDLEYRIFSLQKQMQDKAEQALADQLSAEYSSIEQDKRMNQLKPDKELERLRDIQRQYMSDARDLKLTQEQQLDLSYRIYQAEKSVAEARKQASQDMLDAVTKEFAHRKAMGEDVTAAELARLEEIQRKVTEVSLKEYDLLTESERVYRLTSEQKMDLDEKVYAARIRLAKEAEQAEKSRYDSELKRIQNKVSLGQYSTEDEIKQLEKLKRKYRKNKEIQMELEIKLYNLKRELHQQEVQAVDNLAEAIMEALRNRYEEQRKAEQDRINESIENWQKWEDETVDAIQGQIDALDELNKQQESEEKRREYERKKQALSLQIAYEKDDYQRKQYQQELARLEEEERKRLDEEAREAERKRLEEEMKKAQEESQKQQDDLRDQLDKVNEEYDKMTSDFQLRAEAEKAIMENTQKEIVELIKAFAPEYNLAGQTIGEKLADGFKNKFRDVLNYVQNVTKQISDYQQTLIDQANAAADKFYQTQQNQAQLPQPPASLASAREAQPVQVTVNFNQPVESPVETRRAIESVMNEIARQIG